MTLTLSSSRMTLVHALSAAGQLDEAKAGYVSLAKDVPDSAVVRVDAQAF